MNKTNKICILGIICILFLGKTTNAQLYGDFPDGTSTIDICTCTVGSPIPNQGFAGGSLAIAPNGNVYATTGPDVYYYNVATGTNVFLTTMPGETVGLVFGPDGLLYTAILNNAGDQSLLITINPTTGAINILGQLPLWSVYGDLFFYQGALYGWFFDGISPDPFLAAVNLSNPASSTILFADPDWTAQVAAATVLINGVETILVSAINNTTFEGGLYIFDINTGTYTMLCPNLALADLGAPPGYALPPCCNNDAGSFAGSAPLSACANQTITAVHNGDETLTTGSSLSFVLSTSPTGPFPASVLQTATTPEFAFNSAQMSTNTTYYIVAVAAPGPPGTPNWSASCLDISTAVPVQWQPLPTLQVVNAPAQSCANACAEVTINFTGAFPITLDWQLTINSQITNGSWTANSSTETFSICPETGQNFPTGGLNLSFLQLADGVCVCN